MSNNKVKKAVITAAGRGTRFLPITKIVPKEMLPIGNQPTLYYLLAECKAAGIEEVCIVLRERGSLTEKYFERDLGLEQHLEEKGKFDLLERIKDPSLGLEISFEVQNPAFPIGHGAPVLSAKDWVGEDAFAMLFCDDLISAETPGLTQLVNAWENNPELAGVVMTSPVAADLIHQFSSVKVRPGISVGSSNGDSHGDKSGSLAGVRLLEDYIEKPKPDQVFSLEAFIGRAVYSSAIMAHLEENLGANRDSHGEFSTWDAMVSLSRKQDIGVLMVDGEWLTTGNDEQMRYAAKRILGEE